MVGLPRCADKSADTGVCCRASAPPPAVCSIRALRGRTSDVRNDDVGVPDDDVDVPIEDATDTDGAFSDAINAFPGLTDAATA